MEDYSTESIVSQSYMIGVLSKFLFIGSSAEKELNLFLQLYICKFNEAHVAQLLEILFMLNWI